MKKLMILTAAVMLTVGATGCKCGPMRLWWQCINKNDCAPTSSCDTCSPLGQSYVGSPLVTGDTYLSPPPVITPGPVTTQ